MTDHIIGENIVSLEGIQSLGFLYKSQDSSPFNREPAHGNEKTKAEDISKYFPKQEVNQVELENSGLFSLTSMPSDAEVGDQLKSVDPDTLPLVLNPRMPENKTLRGAAGSMSSAVFSSKWSSEPALRSSTDIIGALLECSFDTRVPVTDNLADCIRSKLSRRVLNSDDNMSPFLRSDISTSTNLNAEYNTQARGLIDSEPLLRSCSYQISNEERNLYCSKSEPEVLSQYIEDIKKTIDKSSWKAKHVNFSPPKGLSRQMAHEKSKESRGSGPSNSLLDYPPRRLVSFEGFSSDYAWDDMHLSKPIRFPNSGSSSRAEIRAEPFRPCCGCIPSTSSQKRRVSFPTNPAEFTYQ